MLSPEVRHQFSIFDVLLNDVKYSGYYCAYGLNAKMILCFLSHTSLRHIRTCNVFQQIWAVGETAKAEAGMSIVVCDLEKVWKR